jgi:hypothetical protein
MSAKFHQQTSTHQWTIRRRRESASGRFTVEPKRWSRRLLQTAILELFVDHPVQSSANPIEVQSLRQRLFLLHGIRRAFHDVRGIEARRERAGWEVLECGHELEDFVHHAVHGLDVVKLPVPESIGRDVGSLERVLHEVENLLQAERRKRLSPKTHRALHALLGKDVFVVAVPVGYEQTIIVGVEARHFTTDFVVRGVASPLLSGARLDVARNIPRLSPCARGPACRADRRR